LPDYPNYYGLAEPDEPEHLASAGEQRMRRGYHRCMSACGGEFGR
jgi:hypothetical protein